MFKKLKIDKKLLKQIDYSIIILCLIITIFGIINIFSATQTHGSGVYDYSYMKLQIMWGVLGCILAYIFLVIDYSIIVNYASIIYWACSALQLFNVLTSKAIKGQSNWIKLGSRAIQPSEFLKIALILMMAKKLNDMEGDINNPKNFFVAAFYAVLPMVLILGGGDMGMTMVCFFIALGIFFIAGLKLKVIFGGLFGIACSIAAVWNSGIIKPYQKLRFESLFYPDSNQLTTTFQLHQALVSIGSGGIKGSGFLKSISYVPEQHNDFIFSIVGQEWGFIGGAVLIICYGMLIYKCIKIAKNSKDLAGSIICVGIISSLIFSIYENIGMNIRMAPITGITLPFMSYGGSSMITNFMAIGLVLNVGMRRKKINF